MYWIVGVMTVSLLGLVAFGLYFDARPVPEKIQSKRWWSRVLGANLFAFIASEFALLFLAVDTVMAQAPEAAAGGAADLSIGAGLAMLGIGIPTGLATIGAGIAVGPVGASALAIISEKPEMFGRTLIYLGLAEGIAIYGLVVTILMLGRLG